MDNYEFNKFEFQNNLFVSVDWLAFTFSSLSFTDILLFLNLNYNDFEPTGRGARGYKQMLKCKHADITILYDGTPNMGTHCEITSKGFYFAMCSFFKPLLVSTPFNSTALDIPFDFTHITYFLGQLVKRAKNISRLDLAIDDYTDDYFTLDSLLDLVQSGRCISKFKSFKYEFSKKIGSLDYTGKTIYFGSRQSNVFLRVYDKALEQKVSNNMKWVRWEFELKNDMAINSINSILKFKSLPTFVFSLLNTYLRFINLDNERRTRCSTYSVWSNFTGNVDKVKLYVKPAVKDIEYIKKWFDTYIGPTLGKIIDADNWDYRFITDNIEQWSYRGGVKLYEDD